MLVHVHTRNTDTIPQLVQWDFRNSPQPHTAVGFRRFKAVSSAHGLPSPLTHLQRESVHVSLYVRAHKQVN